MAFALAFLVVKGFEYHGDIVEGLVPGLHFRLSPPETQIFWSFYWIATGIHALHVTIGIGVLATVYVRLRRRAFDPSSNATIEVAGIYWHFVDVIWIFLYPMLYLVGRS
jgi:cytochrome c oxidase subunit 3